MAVLLQTEAAEGDGDEGEDTKLHMVSRTRIDTEYTAENDGIGGTYSTERDNQGCTGGNSEVSPSHLC